MHIRSFSFSLFLACLLAVSLTACDQSSHNIDFTDGSNLRVDGPSELVLADTVDSVTDEYVVRAFTVLQDYSWSVSGGAGAEIINTRREGEFVDVSFSEQGTYTVEVTTTIDGEEYSGEQVTEVVPPEDDG